MFGVLLHLILAVMEIKMTNEPKPRKLEYDRKGNLMFFCSVREMCLRIEDNSGARCYIGSVENICNVDGKLCDVYEQQRAYESINKK